MFAHKEQSTIWCGYPATTPGFAGGCGVNNHGDTMRRQRAYTDAEILAFDDGFATAIAVARWEILSATAHVSMKPREVSRLLKDVELGMHNWLTYQQEQG